MEWLNRAACAELDPDIFFPESAVFDIEDEVTRQSTLRLKEQAAKVICRTCDVRSECLRTALRAVSSYKDDFGVWGGTTRDERRALRRTRRVVEL